MVDWQITVATIYCDAVDDEVTIMVHRDWSLKCTGYDKYSQPGKEAASLLKKKGKRLNRQLACQGLECNRIIKYKGKLLSEESVKD